MGIGRILHDLKRDRVMTKYADKDRLISPRIYNSLKTKRKCDRCKKPFTHGAKPEIHHKIPRNRGGANTRENLLAVCHSCHKILDAEDAWMNERDEYYCDVCQDAMFVTQEEWRKHLESHNGREE